jgi:hypothetical protein
MISNRFRIYYGPEEAAPGTTVVGGRRSNQVTVPAGEIFAALADAIYNNRAWLQDFENDEITITRDLYDVILAYEHSRRPSA